MDRWVVIALIICTALVLGIRRLAQAGVFTKLLVKECVLGPYLVLYKHATGPYSNVCGEFQRLIESLVAFGLIHRTKASRCTTLGIFFDDPKTAKPQQCRAAVAYVHRADKEVADAKDMAGHHHWLQQLSIVKTGELKVGVFPASRCLMVRAPFLNMMSVWMCVTRAYPRLQKAMQALGARAPKQLQGSLEVYIPGEKTMLVAYPLTQREDLLPYDLPSVTGSEAAAAAAGSSSSSSSSSAADKKLA